MKKKKNLVEFSRELFIESMNKIKKQYDHDKKCNDAFQVILPDDYVIGYANYILQNQLIKILKIAMNDNHDGGWIDYYIWELDFGEKYYEGCVTENDGTAIDLSNAGNLWDYLNNSLK